MKKLLLLLMSFLFFLTFNVGRADAVPDIRGEYSGSYTNVVSNCAESGTYHATLSISISTQTGNTFSGSATGTFQVDAIEYIQLSGTITESGQISGNTSHTFLGTGGEGTFTGQLSGDTLTIENPGHDTYGSTCTYIRYMSATREGGNPEIAKWIFNILEPGGWVSAPAIGSDGTVYASANASGVVNGLLYAVNPDGTQKWMEILSSRVGTPSIGIDGTLYVGVYSYSSGNSYLSAWTSGGIMKWTFPTGENIGMISKAIGRDGTIYVRGWRTLYAVNPDGTQKWAHQIGEWGFSMAIDKHGIIYLPVGYDLFAVNPDGSRKWSISNYPYYFRAPAIGADGTIYIGSDDDNLHAINPDGTQKWVFATANPGSVQWSPGSPAIGQDGTIYIGSRDTKLCAVNPDGTEKWSFQTGELSGLAPAIGGDGTVYIGSQDGNLYAINPDGQQKWTFELFKIEYGYGGLGNPIIGLNGTIYVGAAGRDEDRKLYAKLYALYGGSEGPPDSPWPMFAHDARNSGYAGSIKSIAMPWIPLLLLDD
jgi:outer membrane protein assembly factor BamB